MDNLRQFKAFKAETPSEVADECYDVIGMYDDLSLAHSSDRSIHRTTCDNPLFLEQKYLSEVANLCYDVIVFNKYRLLGGMSEEF